jgi:hypothetical protein
MPERLFFVALSFSTCFQRRVQCNRLDSTIIGIPMKDWCFVQPLLTPPKRQHPVPRRSLIVSKASRQAVVAARMAFIESLPLVA